MFLIKYKLFIKKIKLQLIYKNPLHGGLSYKLIIEQFHNFNLGCSYFLSQLRSNIN